MEEVVAVGRAHGVDLPADHVRAAMERADTVSPEMTSSMHHDLERGNKLEVRWLSGGVVELGRAKGVPTPLNRAIADILALRADGAANGCTPAPARRALHAGRSAAALRAGPA